MTYTYSLEAHYWFDVFAFMVIGITAPVLWYCLPWRTEDILTLRDAGIRVKASVEKVLRG